MKWIGLTGGIATGKSTVAKILRDFGRPVVDADALARLAVAPSTEGLREVVAEFGDEVLTTNGELNRAALGEIIFREPERRARLEAILHPRIQELRARERRELEKKGCDLAFYDVPLLFEKDLEGEFDATVLVYATAEEQRARLAERDGLNPEQIEARLRAQLPIDEKMKRATYIVFNREGLTELKANVAAVLKELQAR